MTHPLVGQFRFTRTEWLRGLEGVKEEDGARHFGQMNCISWIVGHLAWHEQPFCSGVIIESTGNSGKMQCIILYNADVIPKGTMSHKGMIWLGTARATH